MRLSTRLLTNAATTYLRLGTTFALGLFTTWYVLGAVGVTGFGLLALAVSSTGPSHALERALRFGLVRELAAAIASGESSAIRRSVASASRLCRQAVLLLAALVALLSAAAWAGFFNTPADQPELRLALALLILGEGIHAAVRLVSAPFLQSLFAAQRVGLDNLLMVLARVTYPLSALLVFGWLLADRELAVQLIGFAVSRATLQLADVVVGIWLAKRTIPGLRFERAAYDEGEYRLVRSTVWNSSQVAMLLNITPQFMAILINLFFGLAYNTIWQIVVQFAGFAWMFAEGLLRGVAPLSTHLQESGRRGAVVDLMARSVRYQLTVALPALVLLGLYARPLLELWVGHRLSVDPDLAAAGISASQALILAAAMARILLTVQTLRAGFFGVERTLYGLGKVRSYAWFSKWAALISVASGAALMAVLQTPIVAPIGMLFGYGIYSPGVVLLAARREAGLPIGETLRRSVPRPCLAALALLALLILARPFFEQMTPVGLVLLLGGSGVAYALLTLVLVPEADERARLGQYLRRLMQWLTGRAGSGESGG